MISSLLTGTANLYYYPQYDVPDGASLHLNFDADFYWLKSKKKLPDFLTFSRSSTRTYVGADGYVKYAAIDEPCIDYSTGRGGLILEGVVTNLLTRSEEHNVWAKNVSATVDTDVISSPDGTVNGNRLNFSNSSFSGIFRFGIPCTAGTDYTFSHFVKQGSGSGRFRFGSDREEAFGGFNAASIYFNTVTQEFDTVGSQIKDYGYEEYPDGWYRVWLTATTTGADTITNLIFNGSSDSGKSLYVWGSMITETSWLTSYVPTGTTTATKAADNASIEGAAFSQFYNPLEGTMVLDGLFLGSNSSYPTLARVDDGSNGERIGFLVDQSGTPNLGFQIFDGGDYQGIAGATFNPIGQKFLTSGAYKQNDSASSINGSTATHDVSNTIPAGIDRLLFARGSGSSSDCHMIVYAFDYYQTRISNTDVSLLSTPLPTLDLDFEKQRFKLNKQSKTFADLFTSSRASSGTARDADGNIVLYGVDEPRFDYSTGRKGLLIEEQRTNIVDESDAFNWGFVGSVGETLNENALGEFKGARVASNGATWHRAAPSSSILVTSGTKYAITMWYRAGTSGRIRVDLRNSGAAQSGYLYGDVDNPQTIVNTTGDYEDVSTTLLPDGVTYELKFIFTPNFSGSLQPSFGPYTATVGEDIIALGMQVEEGSSHTSYIPTNGTAVTRAADSLIIEGANFKGFYNKSGGTILADFYHAAGINDNQGTYYLSDGSYDNGVGCVQEALGSNYRGRFASDGNFYHTGYSNPGVTPKKFATTYRADDNAHYQNGSASSIASQMAHAPRGVDRLYLGAGADGGRAANMVFYGFKYYPTRMHNDKLEDLTS